MFIFSSIPLLLGCVVIRYRDSFIEAWLHEISEHFMLIDLYMWLSTTLHYDFLIAQHNMGFIIFSYLSIRLLCRCHNNYIVHMILTIRYSNALMYNNRMAVSGTVGTSKKLRDEVKIILQLQQAYSNTTPILCTASWL